MDDYLIYSCSGSCCAMPMNSDDNIVNTYAWMYATSSSKANIKTVMKMLTILLSSAGLCLLETNF